tara:strand:+ start:2231 stop:3790 length:1560 start_codon:yes stop_codon:yes gene_type:complete
MDNLFTPLTKKQVKALRERFGLDKSVVDQLPLTYIEKDWGWTGTKYHTPLKLASPLRALDDMQPFKDYEDALKHMVNTKPVRGQDCVPLHPDRKYAKYYHAHWGYDGDTDAIVCRYSSSGYLHDREPWSHVVYFENGEVELVFDASMTNNKGFVASVFNGVTLATHKRELYYHKKDWQFLDAFTYYVRDCIKENCATQPNVPWVTKCFLDNKHQADSNTGIFSLGWSLKHIRKVFTDADENEYKYDVEYMFYVYAKYVTHKLAGLLGYDKGWRRITTNGAVRFNLVDNCENFEKLYFCQNEESPVKYKLDQTLFRSIKERYYPFVKYFKTLYNFNSDLITEESSGHNHELDNPKSWGPLVRYEGDLNDDTHKDEYKRIIDAQQSAISKMVNNPPEFFNSTSDMYEVLLFIFVARSDYSGTKSLKEWATEHVMKNINPHAETQGNISLYRVRRNLHDPDDVIGSFYHLLKLLFADVLFTPEPCEKHQPNENYLIVEGAYGQFFKTRKVQRIAPPSWVQSI